MADDWKKHLERAADTLGSQAKLAAEMKRCGAEDCSQSKISWLLKVADKISAEDALAVHRATRGDVTASQLRPESVADRRACADRAARAADGARRSKIGARRVSGRANHFTNPASPPASLARHHYPPAPLKKACQAQSLTCSRCGGERENPKHYHCRSCHAADMRERRASKARLRWEVVSREIVLGHLSMAA